MVDEYGLTKQGFKKKSYNDLIKELKEKAKAYLGEEINTEDDSPLGNLLKVIAWFYARHWENAEDVYYSSFINSATGINLDRISKYIGITRLDAEPSTGELLITGDVDFTVPKGTVVQTPSEVKFETLEPVTLDSSGEGTVKIQSMETGGYNNVSAGTITEVVDTISQIDTVTNPEETVDGRDVETDDELRNRYLLSVSKGGSSTLESIRASLLNDVPSLRSAVVKENVTNSTDSDGRPPKSIECYVLGGASEDIGSVILNTKAAGIETYGTETVSIEDTSGTSHDIKFTYVTPKSIYISINLITNNGYTGEVDEKVLTEVIRYIGGEDQDGEVYSGITIGEDVVYNQLIRRIIKVSETIEDVELYIGESASPTGTSNIVIGDVEIAETDYNKVDITNE